MCNLIVSVATPDYIEHYLPMIGSAIVKGEWKGEFCLIVNEECGPDLLKKLKNLNVHVFQVDKLPENPTIHWYKMYLMDEYFKKWDWILYCDLDVLFLNRIELDLDLKDKNTLYTKTDDLSFMGHFLEENLSEEQTIERKRILEQYGDGESLQTCFLLYHSSIIEEKFFDKLKLAYKHYYIEHSICRQPYWDQTIYNIVFYNRWKDLGDRWIHGLKYMHDINWDWKKLDIPYIDNNDYDNVIGLHTFHFCAPWNETNIRFNRIWKQYINI